mmetsp:Transcript_97779/g.273702  ORF Transcript_97779/g.273702 Transcript_97779/m.273702 type:complete len:324 (+) Transcript_97779:274-1245(+)
MRRLQGIVVRHFVEQVVCHMRRSNAVVEEIEDSIGTVDRTQGTPYPGPFALAVVGNTWVRMLQPSVKHQPGVDNKVRVQVPEENWKEAKLHACVDQPKERKDGRRGRQENLERNLFREHGRGRAEMIHDPSIEGLALLVNLSSRGKPQKVEWPADGQVRPHLEASKSTVTHGFVHHGVKRQTLVARSKAIVGTGGRHMRFAIGQVVGTTVVLGVSVLPRKVRHQKRLMDDEANNIVPGLRRGKCSVSALVGDNPRSGPDGSLPERIKTPSQRPCGYGNRVLYVRKIRRQHQADTIRKCSRHNQITNQVHHAPDVGALKAMLRN